MPQLLSARLQRACIDGGRVQRLRLESLGQAVGHLCAGVRVRGERERCARRVAATVNLPIAPQQSNSAIAQGSHPPLLLATPTSHSGAAARTRGEVSKFGERPSRCQPLVSIHSCNCWSRLLRRGGVEGVGVVHNEGCQLTRLARSLCGSSQSHRHPTTPTLAASSLHHSLLAQLAPPASDQISAAWQEKSQTSQRDQADSVRRRSGGGGSDWLADCTSLTTCVLLLLCLAGCSRLAATDRPMSCSGHDRR